VKIPRRMIFILFCVLKACEFLFKNQKHAPSASLVSISSAVYLRFSVELNRKPFFKNQNMILDLEPGPLIITFFFMPHCVEKRCITCFNNIIDLYRIACHKKHKHLLCVIFTSNECRQMSSLRGFLARNIFTVTFLFKVISA
jgi:hypothetical protein